MRASVVVMDDGAFHNLLRERERERERETDRQIDRETDRQTDRSKTNSVNLRKQVSACTELELVRSQTPRRGFNVSN